MRAPNTRPARAASLAWCRMTLHAEAWSAFGRSAIMVRCSSKSALARTASTLPGGCEKSSALTQLRNDIFVDPARFGAGGVSMHNETRQPDVGETFNSVDDLAVAADDHGRRPRRQSLHAIPQMPGQLDHGRFAGIGPRKDMSGVGP